MSQNFDHQPNGFHIDENLFPQEMRAKPNWLNWRYHLRGAEHKKTRVPIQPNGRPPSTIDSQTWSDFDQVINPSVKCDGIGYVFDGVVGSDGLCQVGIDFDKLRERKKRATKCVREAKTRSAYVEVSPSGGGIHVLGRAKPLAKGIHRNSVEIYSNARFFTVTGADASGNNSADISGLADQLAAEVAPDSQKPAEAPMPATSEAPPAAPRPKPVFFIRRTTP
jgi:primase-polymerase (primpol)-like protein